MKRLFFICLFVTLTSAIWVNATYADESTETIEEIDTIEVTETDPIEESTAEENTVVTFTEPEEETESDSEITEEPVTIQQMKDNLEELKTEKEEVSNKWAELSEVNGKILDFLKEDLNDTDIQAIKTLSLDFAQRQSFYEQQLKDNSEENYDTAVSADDDTAAVKANFIQYKLDFYKKLVPYVNTAVKDEYLEYIRSNIAIEQEEKTIKEKIYKQEEGIEERVETIKEKIKEHNEDREEKLDKLIREKVEIKIDAILTTAKMIDLPNEQKGQVLNAVAFKLNEKREIFIANSTDNEYNRKKIDIYDVVIEVLYQKADSLQQ